MQNQGIHGYDNWVFEGVCEMFTLLISRLCSPSYLLQKVLADFEAAVVHKHHKHSAQWALLASHSPLTFDFYSFGSHFTGRLSLLFTTARTFYRTSSWKSVLVTSSHPKSQSVSSKKKRLIGKPITGIYLMPCGCSIKKKNGGNKLFKKRFMLSQALLSSVA